MVESLYVKY